MFTDLDQLHYSNPRSYMNLVKSLRDGSFDKQMPDNPSFVSPEKWHQHFTQLLGPTIPPTPPQLDMVQYVKENSDNK